MDNITMRYKAMVDGLAKEFKEESDNETGKITHDRAPDEEPYVERKAGEGPKAEKQQPTQEVPTNADSTTVVP